MNIQWRHNLLQLQTLVMQQNEEPNTKLIAGHITSLIDCIKEITRDRQALKESLETTSINVSALTYRYNTLKRNSKTEKNELTSITRTQNEETLKKIKDRIAAVKAETNVVDKKLKKVTKENAELTIKAKTAKRMAHELTMCVGSLMQRKADDRINVQKTRCTTIDIYERAKYLTNMLGEIAMDVEMYVSYFQVKMNKVNKDVMEWKIKVYQQDKETALARVNQEDLTKKVQNAIGSINFSKQQLMKEKQKLSGYWNIRDTLTSKISGINRIKEYELQNINDLSKRAADYEIASKESMRKFRIYIQCTQEEIYWANTDYNESSEKRMGLRKILGEKKIRRSCYEKEIQNQKLYIHTRNDSLMQNVLNLATLRSTRLWLKEQMLNAVDGRENIQKHYAKQLSIYNKELEKAQQLKLHIAMECESTAQLCVENKSDLQTFTRSSSTKILVQENKLESEENTLQELEINVVKNRKYLAELQKRISEEAIRFEETKNRLIAEIEALKESMASLKIEIEEMKTEQRKLGPIYEDMEEEYEETVMDYEKYKGLCEERQVERLLECKNVIRCKKKLTEVLISQQECKKKLRIIGIDSLSQMDRHSRNYRENSQATFSLMKIEGSLKVENERLSVACDDLEYYKEDEKQRIFGVKEEYHEDKTKLRRTIHAHEDLFDQSNKTLADSIMESSFSLKKLKDVKTIVTNRLSSMGDVHDKFNTVLHTMEKLHPEASNSSTTSSNKMTTKEKRKKNKEK